MKKSRVAGKKVEKTSVSDPVGSDRSVVVVKPAGYPMQGMLQEYPEFSEPDVFEYYAQEQWQGLTARKGEYLFDKRMFPDFAFKIIDVKPDGSVISRMTTFVIEEIEPDRITIGEDEGIGFEDVIGQGAAKEKCRLIERFLKCPEKFGRWAPRNVLFHGLSGTGKTMLAKALSNRTDVPLFPIKATQLIGEFVGDGARRIHQLYDKAEEVAPCIIFIDELDAIALDRRYQELRGDVAEVVNALLTEMDGILPREGVCTIAATNMVQAIDLSIRSRFEEEIEFKLPDNKERLEILKRHSETFPIGLAEDVDLGEIADKTDGFSGRDLVEKILKTALHQALIEDEETVSSKHLEDALLKAKRPASSQPPKNMFA
ncbi:AAA family ATPase [Methanosarcinales archaeon]|nr:MAG: AAA family ATPase [Methanosarcinales archaeon]